MTRTLGAGLVGLAPLLLSDPAAAHDATTQAQGCGNLEQLLWLLSGVGIVLGRRATHRRRRWVDDRCRATTTARGRDPNGPGAPLASLLRAIRNKRPRSSTWVGRLLLATGLVMGATACDDRRPPPGGASVEDITDQPSAYLGKQVRLAGEVEQVRGPQAFVLEGPGLIWDDEVLVLAGRPIELGGTSVSDDDDVIVEGVVRAAVIADLERELGWDLTPEIEAELSEQPVVVARRIRRIGDLARWSADQPEGEVGFMAIYATVDPARLAGQRLALERVPVQSVSGQAVWVGHTPRAQLLVVPGEGVDLANLHRGDEIDVTGVVRAMPAPADATARWNLDPAMQERLADEPLYLEATEVNHAVVRPAT